MPVYDFRCATHGFFSRPLSVDAERSSSRCPNCGLSARRVYTAPNLNVANKGAGRLLDYTQSTSDAPPVVTALPGNGLKKLASVSANPLTAKLPKP